MEIPRAASLRRRKTRIDLFARAGKRTITEKGEDCCSLLQCRIQLTVEISVEPDFSLRPHMMKCVWSKFHTSSIHNTSTLAATTLKFTPKLTPHNSYPGASTDEVRLYQPSDLGSSRTTHIILHHNRSSTDWSGVHVCTEVLTLCIADQYKELLVDPGCSLRLTDHEGTFGVESYV